MLIGNIGKDPVISASATGRKRVSFSLATSHQNGINGKTGDILVEIDYLNDMVVLIKDRD